MRREINLSTGEITEYDDAPVTPKTNTQLRTEELSALAVKYKEDTTNLQMNWLSAVFNDGTVEETKKAAIQEAFTTLKTTYASDRAAVIAKYP